MEAEMRLDATITVEELGLDVINITPTLQRIAQVGSQLMVHECFISMLGVGDVQIERLPNAIKISICWNEMNNEHLELFIISTPETVTRQQNIYTALQKYLMPSLKGE